jgi:hypothetical protein
VHHRGLYAQTIGGLIVAALIAAVPVVWMLPGDDSRRTVVARHPRR